MLLSSKNDESDENKTLKVYSSYITVANNIFKQQKTNKQKKHYLIRALCYGKSVTFF